MSNSVYNLRYTELDPSVAAKIWPFVAAYRPHEEVRSWRVLREEGYEPFEEESLMDVIEDQWEAEQEVAN
jgi:hypothetical protein